VSLSNRTIALLAKPLADGAGPRQTAIVSIWREAGASAYLGEGSKYSRVLSGLRALRDGRPAAPGAPRVPPDHDKLRAVAYELATRLVAAGLVGASDVREALDGDIREDDKPPEAPPRPVASSRTVFVVHGHDGGLRDMVVLTLVRLELEPIVLDEQPGKGRALIEKFEQHSLDVGFAVVILAPEDRGAGPGDRAPRKPNRARQNVVLELGYFMGALGRDHIAVLHKDEVELPSDIHGIDFIPMRDDWRYRLAAEIAAAGIDVDMNRLR
jgi:predicted nucleotide-binding protein